MSQVKIFNQGTLLNSHVITDNELERVPFYTLPPADSINEILTKGQSSFSNFGGSAGPLDNYRILLQAFHNAALPAYGNQPEGLIWWGAGSDPYPNENNQLKIDLLYSLGVGAGASIINSSDWSITTDLTENGAPATLYTEFDGLGYFMYEEKHTLAYGGLMFDVLYEDGTSSQLSKQTLESFFSTIFAYGNQLSTTWYKDYVFSFDPPLSRQEQEDLTLPNTVKSKIFNVKPVYNYYIKEYEDAISESGWRNYAFGGGSQETFNTELTYPNYYAFIYKDLSEEQRGALTYFPSVHDTGQAFGGRFAGFAESPPTTITHYFDAEGNWVSAPVEGGHESSSERNTSTIARVLGLIKLSKKPVLGSYPIIPGEEPFFNLVHVNKNESESMHSRKYKRTSRGKYFEKWARRWSALWNIGGSPVINTFRPIGRYFRNIIIPADSVEMLKRHNEKKHLFPMYNEITFSTDKKVIFSNILAETGISSALMEKVASDVFSWEVLQKSGEPPSTGDTWQDSVDKGVASLEDLTFISQDPNWVPGDLDDDDVAPLIGKARQTTNPPTTKPALTWDLIRWWELFKENNGQHWDGSVMASMINLGLDSKFISNDAGKNSTPSFVKALNLWICDKKIKKAVNSLLRTYRDIVTNKREAYAETVFYRVAKWGDWQGKPDEGNSIQNYFFANSSETDMINFIDTQVRYKKKYHYKIFAYTLVVGSQYRFMKVDSDTGAPTSNNNAPWIHSYTTTDTAAGVRFDPPTDAQIYVQTIPFIKLVEVPYAQTTKPISVLDNPPVWPDVQVIPYRGVDNKILFNFNGNVGDYKAEPIYLVGGAEGDTHAMAAAFRELSEEPFIDPEYHMNGNVIRYKSDDPPREFQIFRIEKLPSSYEDFRGTPTGIAVTEYSTEQKGKSSASTGGSTAKLMRASSAAFVDSIEPNKKYYYIFRTIDVHDNWSNPSPVYEVELVNDSGYVYPLVRIIDMDVATAYEAERVKKPIKTMKKYVEITPSFAQGSIDLEKSESGEANVTMGTEETSLWEYDGTNGKIFKIRITSRTTGKIFDLNVKFNHKHTALIEDKQQGD